MNFLYKHTFWKWHLDSTYRGTIENLYYTFKMVSAIVWFFGWAVICVWWFAILYGPICVTALGLFIIMNTILISYITMKNVNFAKPFRLFMLLWINFCFLFFILFLMKIKNKRVNIHNWILNEKELDKSSFDLKQIHIDGENNKYNYENDV